MAKNQTQEKAKTQSKEIRMNVNYVNFIARVREEKLEQVNHEKLAEVYQEELGLKASNIERVSKRVNRAQLKSILTQELEAKKISYKDFQETNKKVLEQLKAKKNNYLTVTL